MPHQSELRFLRSIFAKYNLQMLMLDPWSEPDQRLDLGFRKTLGMEENYGKSLYHVFRKARENTIYHMTDEFDCYYVFCSFPDVEKSVLVIGPYLTDELTHERILEQAEQLSTQPQLLQRVEKHFGNVPVIADDSVLFGVLETLAEHIGGKNDAFEIVELKKKTELESLPAPMLEDPARLEATQWDILSSEKRYAHENDLLRAVSLGQIQKVKLMLAGANALAFEQRIADSLRNMKNYCIVMNTLLRKAVEAGGVHPLYLDRTSSGFARKIEMTVSLDGIKELMNEMFEEYCQLVRRHATQQYSPLVQRTILYADMNLGGDLSLKVLANAQNVNASYLSAQFKKETGQTLTDYVNQKRVRYASGLLRDTRLQIQTIAQHCGVTDVNYFSKLFKKYTGKTPKEYRKEDQNRLLQRSVT